MLHCAAYRCTVKCIFVLIGMPTGLLSLGISEAVRAADWLAVALVLPLIRAIQAIKQYSKQWRSTVFHMRSIFFPCMVMFLVSVFAFFCVR